MEAWDVVILGDGPAALSAAAQASKDGADVLMMSSTALGDSGMGAMNGIACHIQEESNRGHREDTIKMGAFSAIKTLLRAVRRKHSELLTYSNAGVNFRRDAKGIVKGHYASGHSKPRLCNAGDATAREIQQVLEEQCMKYGVTRRSDRIPMELIHTDYSINGLIAIDMLNGRVLSIQCKALSLLMADLKEHSPTVLHRLVWTQPTRAVHRCEIWNSLRKVHLVSSARIWLFLNRSYPMVLHFTRLLVLHWKHLQPHQL